MSRALRSNNRMFVREDLDLTLGDLDRCVFGETLRTGGLGVV
jgi:hypothetical protein